MFAHVSIYYSYLLTKHKLQIAPSTFHVLGFFFAVLSFKISRVDIFCVGKLLLLRIASTSMVFIRRSAGILGGWLASPQYSKSPWEHAKHRETTSVSQ